MDWTFIITDILTDYIYVLTDVRTRAPITAHVSRIIFFQDSKYEVTAPLLKQSVYYSLGNEIIEFTNIKLDEYSNDYLLCTKWLGIEEPTWENLIDMSKYASLVQKFLSSHQDKSLVRKLTKSLKFE
jgi:hypothetical protein